MARINSRVGLLGDTKSGMWVILLGVLGVIIGGAIYAMDWHKTIGTGGMGVGIVLLVVGGYMLMRKTTPAQVVKPAQATTHP